MGAQTNDKIIRVRADISQPIAAAQALGTAFTSSIAGVNPALAQLINNLNGAGNAAGGVGGQANAANNNVRSLTGSLGGLNGAATQAMSQLSGMGGTLTGIGFAGAALGVTAVVGGLTALAGAAVKASAEMQGYRASLTTVLGDADKAAQAMDRLTQFAAKTPFSLNQSVEGFIKLKALGLQPSEAAMMSYGNTASALGKDLNQMVEAVADAATGEFERLKEFGIKSKNEGDRVKFTFQGVTTDVANNSTEIQKYLMGIGNVQFAGAMEKQMLTFSGAVSNLEDTWFQTMAAMGDAGLADSVGGVINMITNGLTSMKPVFVGLGSAIGAIINGVASAASGVMNLFAGITSNGGTGLTFVESLALAFNVVGQTVEVTGNIIGAVFSAAGQVIGGVVGTVRNWFADLWGWLSGSTSTTTGNMSLSFIGVLRAGKYLTENLQKIFSSSLSAIGGMFTIIGQRMLDFIGGNWSAFDGIGGAIAAQFKAAGTVIDGVWEKTKAIANDSKGAQAAWDKLTGKTNAKGGASLDELAGAPPPAGAASGKDDAAKKAAERAKREMEFWQTLKDQTTAAGMLSNQAEIYNKSLELRKVLERDLTAEEQSRLATAMGELNAAKAITAIKQQTFEAANKYTVELGRTKGLTDTQRAVEDELFKNRVDALNKGVDINSSAYKLAEADLKTQLEKNEALKAQNDLLKRAQDFMLSVSSGARAKDDLTKLEADYKSWRDAVAKGDLAPTFADQIVAGYESAKLKIEQDAIRLVLDMSPTADRNARIAQANADYREASAQLRDMTLTPQARKDLEREIFTSHQLALGKIAAESSREWIDQIDGLADYFGGRFGTILKKIADGFDGIANMASGNLIGPAGMLAKLLDRQGTYADTAKGFTIPQVGEALKSPLKSLSDGFGDFKSMFSGDLATGITKGFTKLQAGAQIGGMVAGIGGMLGLSKNGQKGAEIGGTLGGLFGPVGSIIGSLGGGLIGSLFGTKAKYGTASLTGTGDAVISGNSASRKSATSGAAGSVQDALSALADQLGGVVGSYAVSIGTYKDAWRVSDSGRTGKLKTKYSDVVDFGKDGQADAIEYAVKNAIADGAITGLAPIIQKALGTLATDSAVQFAKDWKAAMDDYKSMIDPIASVVDGIVKPLQTLRETMLKVGASTEDLTKIDDYRTLKLKAASKEQLSSLTDFLSALKGEGSGVSKLDQLTTKMAEFETYRTRINAGDSNVDQAAFTALGQSIFSLAGDIYGTATSQFQNVRSDLTGTAQKLSDNVTNAFNTAVGGYDAAQTVTSIDNTTAAIQAQSAAAAAYYTAQANSNALVQSYLKQIAANTEVGVTTSGTATGTSGINGRSLVNAY